MNKNNLLPAFILIMIITISCQPLDREVTLSGLLNEMTDRNIISEFPSPAFTVSQFSSYDRHSVSPDSAGWFANHDASWFIRQEENNGRREFVMFDAKGPGALVRFWMTFGDKDAYTGVIRFYFDGSDKPEIEGPVLDIISGGALVDEPLSSSVSPESNYYQRGHNLYLPIPYSDHLKITYECEALDYEKHSPSVYYNIDYRTYNKNIPVRSFTKKGLDSLSTLIDKVQNKLKSFNNTLSKVNNVKLDREKGTLASGESFSVSVPGSGAIRKIQLKIDAKDIPQALRSTVLDITFDGERTVWAPVGDFFGTGYKICEYNTLYSSVSEDSTLECNWVMPFSENARVTITNLGDQDVDILKFHVITKDYIWNKNSMHFGASWHELHKIESVNDEDTGDSDGHFDVNFVTLKGEGVYIGSGLTVFNTANAWWGEGDEKIWVDNETFPSFVGTGTEDYFGYAWCLPAKFSHFLIAQPDGSGNFNPGMSVNLRYYLLDRIPFKDSLRFDMELWHWIKTTINYAPISYWYMIPGGTSNIKPNPEAAKQTVAIKKTDLIKPKQVKDGIMEGEDLRILEVSNGNYYLQSIDDLKWSNNTQLWWIAGSVDATLTADFIVPEAGKYQIEMIFTKAIDYADFKVAFNGVYGNKVFSGYHDQTGREVIKDSGSLGTFILHKGINTVTIKTAGKNPEAVPQYMVGIDVFRLKKII
jgi:hypothetical protein